MSRHFDAIIVGTGQAGPSLAARFAGAGEIFPLEKTEEAYARVLSGKAQFRVVLTMR